MSGSASLKKRQADPCFQFLDAPAQRGLGDIQRFGGTAETAVLGQCLGLSEQAEVNLHALNIPKTHENHSKIGIALCNRPEALSRPFVDS